EYSQLERALPPQSELRRSFLGLARQPSRPPLALCWGWVGQFRNADSQLLAPTQLQFQIAQPFCAIYRELCIIAGMHLQQLAIEIVRGLVTVDFQNLVAGHDAEACRITLSIYRYHLRSCVEVLHQLEP